LNTHDYIYTVEVGPFSVHFTNINRVMGLPGHSHFAQVRFVFETVGRIGFPSFADTHAAIQLRLAELTAKPFRDSTNEQVLEEIWSAFDGWENPEAGKYACEGMDYKIRSVALSVRGVPDRVGHADGFTTYRKERMP
jgi:hypothetical protein